MLLPHNVQPPTPFEGKSIDELVLMIVGKLHLSWGSYIGRVRDIQTRKVMEVDEIVDIEPRMKAMRSLTNMGQDNERLTHHLSVFNIPLGLQS
ncbi:hypothetical protein L204_106155 [Cryptococcus depauperatus]|nr:hypothetical protein L204_05714 [Cryptococcus depauperatus CBS 7855]